MNRREFLQLLGGGSAVALLMPHCSPLQGGTHGVSNFETSLDLYDSITFEKIDRFCRELEIHHAEHPTLEWALKTPEEMETFEGRWGKVLKPEEKQAFLATWEVGDE